SRNVSRPREAAGRSDRNSAAASTDSDSTSAMLYTRCLTRTRPDQPGAVPVIAVRRSAALAAPVVVLDPDGDFQAEA
ncbi:hypothetical protein, partial [Streptomyces sp. NPDC101224]|uniref:hypothetical protein n=1 Tax=Streptomyces sp. NPDC101224 TaxID=3366134 RepID=UPI0037FD5ECC